MNKAVTALLVVLLLVIIYVVWQRSKKDTYAGNNFGWRHVDFQFAGPHVPARKRVPATCGNRDVSCHARCTYSPAGMTFTDCMSSCKAGELGTVAPSSCRPCADCAGCAGSV